MVRQKKRYFIFSVVLPKRKEGFIKINYLKTSIVNAVNQLYGEFGVAVVLNGFQVKYSNFETGIFYIRVNRDAHAFVTAALPIIISIGADDACVSCLHTAATLRHANILLKDHHLKSLRRATDTNHPTVEDQCNLKINKREATSPKKHSTMKRKSFKEKVLLKRKRRV